MQIDLLKNIALTIVPLGGEKIIEILHNKKNVNEFLISKKLDLTINQTRNILYKLLDAGLVKFTRKKDKKKGGWYTYFWTLNTRKAIELLKTSIETEIARLQEDLDKRKKERFYFSPEANIEYTEEEALEHNFICPETGEVLRLKDDSELIDKLDIEISKLKILIQEVSLELSSIEKKEASKKERKLKAEAKKKEVERKARREKLKRERMKEAKKLGKKITKKKPVKKKSKKKAKKTPKKKQKTKPKKLSKKKPKKTKKKTSKKKSKKR